MQRPIQTLKFILLASIFTTQIMGEIKIERQPASYGMFMEFGQIAHGWEFVETDDKIRGEVDQRTGLYIMQRATVNDRLKLNIGVGGLFFYVPQTAGLEHTIGVKFGPGIAETNIEYHFGDPDKGNSFLKVGYWPMKYNKNAKNLGEYLYRSGTYPGFLVTGGWSVVNYAFYYAQGIQYHLSLLDGIFNQDFTLFMERDYFPNHNLTPTYLFNFDVGAFQFGGGVSFHHLIAMKPSLLTKDAENSTYLYFNSFPASGEVQDDNGVPVLPATINGQAVEGLESALLEYKTEDPVTPGDSITVVDQKWWEDQLNIRGGAFNLDTTKLRESELSSSEKVERLYCQTANPTICADQATVGADPNYIRVDKKRYLETNEYVYAREEFQFSHRGIKMMFNASLDLKPLLGWEESLSPEDLVFFMEGALLGFEDRPFFYENKMHRIPVMFGFNAPTFKIFDILSFQFEYYNSQFDNNIETFYKESAPVWTLPQNLPWNEQATAKDDNWNWSIFAKKTWMETVSLYLQVANDHLRTFHPDFVRPFVGTVLPTSKDWYYMLRFEVTI